jgi:hypothetical protein
MVGSWPWKVSSDIHINGRSVSESVCEDRGKTTAPEPEDKKDPERARVALSECREVVGPGYSRMIGVAVHVMDKKENSSNHGRINRVSQNNNTDRQADRVRVGQVTRVSPNSSMDQ